MKKLFSAFFVLFMVITLNTRAQQTTTKPDTANTMKMTFAEFETWMKTLTPAGYPFTETGKNGPDFMATFMNKETFKMIGITLSPLNSFEDYKKAKKYFEPYVRNELRHVLYGIENFWNLKVEVKSLNACFEVTTVYIPNQDQKTLEKILDETGIYKK